MSCTRGSKYNNSKMSVKEENTQRDSTSTDDMLDFTAICRICASTSEYLIPIYDGEGLTTRLKEKIEKHLPIQINKEDKLPLQLCYQCTSTLLAWNELVQCCLHSEQLLKKQLEQISNDQNLSVKSEKDAAPSTSKEGGEVLEVNVDSPNSRIEQQMLRDVPVPIVRLEQLDMIIVNANALATNIYSCSYCQVVFSTEENYKKHLISSHSDLLFHCDECDTYVDRQELILHMSLHAVRNSPDGKAEEKPYANVKGEDASQLFSDGESNDGFEPIPESIFEAIEDLKAEEFSEKVTEPVVTITTETNEKKDKILECPLCSKTFRAPSSFFYHKKFVHTDNRDKQCEICQRKFTTNTALKDHMSIHTGDKSLQCEHCGKEFRSKASVYIHKKNMHTDGKEFICAQCNRSFRWKQKLIRHQHSHTKEKNFFCPECDRGFSIRCDLTRHMKTHTSLKPYKCTKCGATFAQRRYLKKHMSLKHEVAPNIK